MRLVFAGTPETALPSLEALLASEHEVLAVLTRPDARAGRGRTLHPSPVKAVALEHGIEVLTPVSPRDPDFQSRLRELAPDACPVVAYGALLPADVLEKNPGAAVGPRDESVEMHGRQVQVRENLLVHVPFHQGLDRRAPLGDD